MAISAKCTMAHLPGAEVALFRFLFGLCAFGVAASRLRLQVVNLRGLVLRGLFGALAVLLYFIAISKIPVGAATLLTYTAPIFTALFAALFIGERLTLSTFLALGLALVGVVLVLRDQAAGLGWGIWEACGLLSAVLSGAAVTTIRAVRKTDGSWEIFCAFCLVGVLVCAPLAVHQWVTPTARDWQLLAAVGVLSISGQLLFTYALRHIRAATAGVISQLTPVTAFALGALLLHDPVRPPTLLGAALTLLGVAWGARY